MVELASERSIFVGMHQLAVVVDWWYVQGILQEKKKMQADSGGPDDGAVRQLACVV